ncbi:MAG: glucosaminidase domain-containing protein [Chloroflexota bacterium]
MIAVSARPMLDVQGALQGDVLPYHGARKPRRFATARVRLLAGAVLLIGLAATQVVRQPSDLASAYDASGAIVQAAEVLTPVDPTPPAALVVGGKQRSPLIISVPNSPPAAADRPGGHLLPPATGAALAGGPTISPAQINAVLTRYGSPMAGDGQALYDLGVKYGIDPAYCLAFFVHESGAGTQGEAVLTHNLGNIRSIAGYPSMDGYRYFDTWLEGAEAWYQLIAGLYIKQWNLSTVDQIIPVYAPSADSNDPAAYINDVEQLVAGWRGQ